MSIFSFLKPAKSCYLTADVSVLFQIYSGKGKSSRCIKLTCLYVQSHCKLACKSSVFSFCIFNSGRETSRFFSLLSSCCDPSQEIRSADLRNEICLVLQGYKQVRITWYYSSFFFICSSGYLFMSFWVFTC